jgi:hypothetical protein
VSARQQLEQLGVPAELLDAYEHDVRADVAEELYTTDNGSYEGCWCAELVDPDRPCPSCKGEGGFRLGIKCDTCGLERTTPRPEPRGPTLVPQSFIQDLIAQFGRLEKPAPRFTGVLEFLQDGDP